MKCTTLNEIKKYNPCTSGWETLLSGLNKTKADDEPLAYSKILEINGIADAIWSLRTSRKLAVAYAIACAEKVLPIFESKRPGDMRVRDCINAAKLFINGKISREELLAKRLAAHDTFDTYAAAAAATYAAAAAAYDAHDAHDATYAATYAAYAAAAAHDASARQKFKAEVFLSIVDSD